MKTLKQNIKLTKNQYKILKDYSHYSNNLYNYSLYVVNKYFEETGKYMGISKLEKEVKCDRNYKLLPVQSSQQIVRLVDQNFRSFFALLNKKSKGQYDDKVIKPKFKKKGSCFNVIFTNQNSKYRNKKLFFYRSLSYKELNANILELDFSMKISGIIKQIMFKPINNGQFFTMFINYEENKKEIKTLNMENFLSIDLGINNFASCFTNTGHSFLVNGKPLKSYNRWYNKKVAEIKSELEVKNKMKWSKKLCKMSLDRCNWIDNYFNKTVNYIVKYCVKNDIGNIIVGYNQSWKQEVNLGKINNQKFSYIPYSLFKRKLENKCLDNGIKFILQDEIYTSKCSSLDNESVEKHEIYLGKRQKRGLFLTSKKIKINADINGSANIARKVFPKFKINNGIVGLMLNPIKLNIL